MIILNIPRLRGILEGKLEGKVITGSVVSSELPLGVVAVHHSGDNRDGIRGSLYLIDLRGIKVFGNKGVMVPFWAREVWFSMQYECRLILQGTVYNAFGDGKVVADYWRLDAFLFNQGLAPDLDPHERHLLNRIALYTKRDRLYEVFDSLPPWTDREGVKTLIKGVKEQILILEGSYE